MSRIKTTKIVTDFSTESPYSVDDDDSDLSPTPEFKVSFHRKKSYDLAKLFDNKSNKSNKPMAHNNNTVQSNSNHHRRRHKHKKRRKRSILMTQFNENTLPSSEMDGPRLSRPNSASPPRPSVKLDNHLKEIPHQRGPSLSPEPPLPRVDKYAYKFIETNTPKMGVILDDISATFSVSPPDDSSSVLMTKMSGSFGSLQDYTASPMDLDESIQIIEPIVDSRGGGTEVVTGVTSPQVIIDDDSEILEIEESLEEDPSSSASVHMSHIPITPSYTTPRCLRMAINSLNPRDSSQSARYSHNNRRRRGSATSLASNTTTGYALTVVNLPSSRPSEKSIAGTSIFSFRSGKTLITPKMNFTEEGSLSLAVDDRSLRPNASMTSLIARPSDSMLFRDAIENETDSKLDQNTVSTAGTVLSADPAGVDEAELVDLDVSVTQTQSGVDSVCLGSSMSSESLHTESDSESVPKEDEKEFDGLDNEWISPDYAEIN